MVKRTLAGEHIFPGAAPAVEVEHIMSAHSGHINKHSATPSNRWSIEPGYHYRACRYCSDTAHYAGKAAHSFNKAGVCTVCGYKNGAVIEGFDTNTFSVSFPYYACQQNYYVYCDIHDESGENRVLSDRVKINADHNYTKAIKTMVDGDRSNTFTDKFDGKSFTYVHSSGHYLYCVGCYNRGISIENLLRRLAVQYEKQGE